ncbi:MAG: phytanoyl-CoA dioxygenase family protein [Rhodospirillaceae bacterium]
MANITDAQKKSYQDVGTVHVPGAVTAEKVGQLTKIIDDVIERVRSGKMPQRSEDDPVFLDIEIEDHDGYVRIINVMPRVPSIKDWLFSTNLPDIVADLIGADSLRIWLDGTFSKVGSSSKTATPWHTDESTFSLQGEHLPSLWIGLTNVDEDNSPLITLAGSHKDKHRYHSPYSPQNVDLPSDYRPWSALMAQAEDPDADIRVWTAKAGDILLIHPKTIHAALPRTSDDGGRRLAFTIRWVGSDVVWNPNPLTMLAPFDSNPLMERGKPPPEELFPVVWRRGATVTTND